MRASLHALVWSFVGLVAALSSAPPGPSGPGAASLWVADRAAGAVVALDARGLVVRRVEVSAPVAIAADGGGGVWAWSATEAVPRGPHALVRIAPGGALSERIPTGAPRDPASPLLVVDHTGRPYVAEAELGAHALSGFPARGAPRAVDAGCEARVAGCAGGRLWSVDDDCVVAVVAVAAGHATAEAVRGDSLPAAVEARSVHLDPDGRGAWVLARAAFGACVVRLQLDRAGAPRRVWVKSVPLEPGALAVAPGADRAWLVEARGSRVAGLTAESRTRWWRRDLPRGGIELGLGAADGGAWLASGGALVRLGPEGSARPGQGGFGHVVGLATARAAAPD